MKKFLSIILVLAVVLGVYNCGGTSPFVTGAKIDLQRNDYVAAEGKLKQAIQSNPKDQEAYYWLGKVYANEKMSENYEVKERHEMMMKNFNKALEVGNKFETDITATLNDAYNKLYYNGAVAFNGGIGRLKSEDEKEREKAQKNFQTAKENIETALIVMPKKVNALVLLGDIYLQLDKKEAAEKVYKEALTIEPKNLKALKNVANVLIELDKEKEAIDYLKKALEVEPNNAQILLNLAQYYNLEKDYAQAKEYYNKLLALDPENVNFLFNKGLIESALENTDAAIEIFKKVVTLDPEDQQARIILADFYQQEKKYQEAVDTLEPIIEKINNEHMRSAYNIMFNCLIGLNRNKEAQKYYLK